MAGFTSLGEATLGVVVPVALTATATATASINLQLPELQTKLAAQVALLANVTLTPPTIVASIQTLLTLAAGFQAALVAGAPDVLIEVSAIIAAMAEITATIASLNAQLGIAVGIEAQLGGASVHLLRYDGPVSGLVPTGISGVSPSANVNSILIVATTSAAWAAMQTVFKTS